MKRLFTMVLLAVLVVSISAGVVYADPPWDNKGKPASHSKALKKAFDDADEISWAHKAIEKLKLKGIIRGNEGSFFPSNTVKKAEVLAMALRIMEWEEEAQEEKDLPEEYNGESVPVWAVGYVTVACQRGILDYTDLRKFNPNAAAKRYEVAKYIVRALGYEEEAQERMNEVLPFKDAPSAPKDSIGYIYLVYKMGIMEGDGSNFNPMGSLSRAEMAVVFNNIDDLVDSDMDSNEYTGVLYEKSDDKIILKIDGKLVDYSVSNEVRVFDGRNRISYDMLEEGVEVKILVNPVDTEEGNEVSEVIFIKIVNEEEDEKKIISRYTGTITNISGKEPIEITIRDQDMLLIFKANSDVETYFDGEEGSLSEIEEGDEVTITVDNRNRARVINVHRKRAKQNIIKGVLSYLNIDDDCYIKINKTIYHISEDADIKIDGEEADIEDLEIGMKVVALLKESTVEEIDAENVEEEVEGILKEVGDTSIKIIIDGREKEYEYKNGLTVQVEDDENANLNDIKEGMEIELTLQNGCVIHIEAEDNE